MPLPLIAPLPLPVRADLFAHLAAMEKAGLPTDKAFALLKLPQLGHDRLTATRRHLARHADIASAGLRTGLFTPLEAALIRAAATAGSPAITYRRLAERYALIVRQRSQLRSRCMLPLVLLLAGSLIQPLPRLVAGTVSIGGYLWLAIRPLLQIGLLIAVGLGLRAWLSSGNDSALRTTLQHWLLRIPLAGRMIVQLNLRDFFESLGMLLEAGVPMFDALPLAEVTVTNPVVRTEVAVLLPLMESGTTLADALCCISTSDANGIATLTALASTGEASGTLPDMLLRFAAAESAHLQQAQQPLADWIPRLFYFFYAGLFVFELLTGGGIAPAVPSDL